MFPALLIALRECFEAGLITAVLAASTYGVGGRSRWLTLGALAGSGGAIGTAFLSAPMRDISQLSPGEVQAALYCTAAVLLAWQSLWLTGHIRELRYASRPVGQAISCGRGGLLAFASIVALAVFREGSELIFFIRDTVPAARSTLIGGGFLGLNAGGLISWGLYRALLAMPWSQRFIVTNTLAAFLASGMAGRAAAILAREHVVPSLGDAVWDTSAFVPDDSLVGHTLRGLLGYAARPSGIQILIYVTALVAVVVLGELTMDRRRQRT